SQENNMDKANGRKILPYIVLLIFVALVGYGLGAATIYVAQGKSPIAALNGGSNNENNTTASTTPSRPGEQGNTQPPAGVDEQMKPFWSTFNAVQDEFYYRPKDSQKMIYGAAKGMMQSLGDDFSTF